MTDPRDVLIMLERRKKTMADALTAVEAEAKFIGDNAPAGCRERLLLTRLIGEAMIDNLELEKRRVEYETEQQAAQEQTNVLLKQLAARPAISFVRVVVAIIISAVSSAGGVAGLLKWLQ